MESRFKLITRRAQQRPCVISEKSLIIHVKPRSVIIDVSQSKYSYKSSPQKDFDYSHIILTRCRCRNITRKKFFHHRKTYGSFIDTRFSGTLRPCGTFRVFVNFHRPQSKLS